MDVVIEVGKRRCFASALDWPGWCRAGRDEQSAVDALLDYRERYAAVAAAASLDLPKRPAVRVVERLPGDATTDFGAPGSVARAEFAPSAAAFATRQSSLVRAAWSVFDDVVAAAPAVLRKGPRGGGRDRDAIVEHVRAAEAAYARKLGVSPREEPDLHAAILAVLGVANDGTPQRDKGWPRRYAARRIAWHVLDHAWEIEDKSD